MKPFQILFSAVKIGPLQLKNRFVVPPMATNLATEDGAVTQALIDYWTARARGGWGLLIVEFTAIDPLGRVGLCHPVIWDDKYIEGFQELTHAVHSHGAKIAVQLSHTGRQTTRRILRGEQPVSASPIPCPLDREMPRQLSQKEIYELIEKFGDAALRAQKAGFDAVEIHGAHGYLIAQFMSAYSNKRTDDFGGSLHNRIKFPVEIIRNIRHKIGRSYPLLFRISGEERIPGGRTIEETRVIARILEDEGIDAIDVSVGVSGSSQFIIPPAAVAPGFLLQNSGEIKTAVSVPVIAVGRINHPLLAEEAIKSGKADLIAWGRASLADPDLPNKVSAGQLDDICPCIACVQGCTRNFPYPDKPLSKLGVTCLANPFCGYEGEMIIKPAANSKKVIIAGGGPAGLEAAWIAASRGHDVTLYEKKAEFGGQYRIASIPPFKQEIARLINYYVHMCHKFGVHLLTETEATAKNIIEEKPDTVIIASGAEVLIPQIEGVATRNVVTAWDILEGKREAGRKVLVLGGGMVGCEVADFLGEHLHDVTIVEALPTIAVDVAPSVSYFLLRRLKEYNVNIETNTSVIKIMDNGIIARNNNREFSMDGFDTIVLALGTKPVNNLKSELEGKVPEIFIIGDALAPRQAIDAIQEGASIALKI